MAVTEDRRHELYKGLEEVMDTQRATTLMELLPPVGWADVATKHDLDHLSEVMGKEFAIVRLQVENSENRMRADLEHRMRSVLVAVYGSTTALAALVVAAVKLI